MNGEAKSPLQPARLAPGRQLALFTRSLLLQASWSFERMQTIGFAALLSGEGRRLTRGRPDAARAFLARQMTFFNTNPPMVGYLAGVALRLEEEADRLAVASPAEAARVLGEMERFKRAGVSAFAAWGDRFYWATLRPAATAVAVVVVLLAGAWGAVAWLIVYNAAHLHYRFRGLSEGYRLGPAVAGRVAGSVLKQLPDRARRVGLAAVGILVPLSLGAARQVFGWGAAAAFLAAGLAAAWILRRRGGIGWEWGFVAVAAGFGWALLAGGR